MSSQKLERIRTLMSDSFDVQTHSNSPLQATHLVCICSSPRTGSSLIADILSQTNMSGVPMEYLNKDYYSYSRDFNEGAGFDHYFDHIVQRRTSSNGVFALKTHFFQMIDVLKEHTFDIRRWAGNRPCAWIFVKRADKIAQAVSLYRALKTDQWTRYQNEPGLPSAELYYDEQEIYRLHQLMLYDETRWKTFFRLNRLPVLEMTYENFSTERGDETAQRLLMHLQRTFGAEVIPKVEVSVKHRLIKQGASIDVLCQRFSNFLQEKESRGCRPS
jgi:trehalose 2-sulfotransferase